MAVMQGRGPCCPCCQHTRCPQPRGSTAVQHDPQRHPRHSRQRHPQPHTRVHPGPRAPVSSGCTRLPVVPREGEEGPQNVLVGVLAPEDTQNKAPAPPAGQTALGMRPAQSTRNAACCGHEQVTQPGLWRSAGRPTLPADASGARWGPGASRALSCVD